MTAVAPAQLAQAPSETAAEIIAALARARTLPEAALHAAVARADEIAPAVIHLVEEAARGVFLMPEQRNLVFWGIHAMAAAQRPQLHRPLLRLARQAQLASPLRRTLIKVLISTFDGDPEPLLAACADKNVVGDLRWDLMLVLARLTFDGKIPRETTLAFVDRFERELLADPADPAWDGWQDIITFLGLEEMRDRLRASWLEERNPQSQEEWSGLERTLAIAQALAPGDDALFLEDGVVPLGDPVEALHWTLQWGRHSDEDDRDSNDPAGIFALKDFETAWLEASLGSSKVPPTAMTLEQIDGFFNALVAGPVGTRLDDCLGMLWNADDPANATPRYDNPEQEQYVLALLRRYWTAIGRRLEQAYPAHLALDRRDPWQGQDWAAAFLFGMSMRDAEWRLRVGEKTIGIVAQIVIALRADRIEAEKDRITPEFRKKMIAILPKRLVALHHAWRGRADPFPPTARRVTPGRNVGRNERCPCRSGRKFKHCCGSADNPR